MDQHIVFRNDKRLRLREDDMSVDNLSRIFHVSRQSIYLTNDENVVVVAGASGLFRPVDLMGNNHYEVHGVPDEIPAPAPASVPAPAVARFAFARTATATATQSTTPVTAPRVAGKPFQRSLYLSDVVDGRLNPSRMVVIRFMESEATIEGITAKIQEAIGNPEPLVLTDTLGNSIMDSEGTRGSQYWKQNARKIFALKEEAFEELERRKRRRRSG